MRDETHAGLRVITFTLPGAPRTKKNGSRIWKVGRRTVVKPSQAWIEWKQDCLAYSLASPGFRLLLTEPMNCAATFYRDRASGDAVNYYEGLADVLEECGVVANDRYIVSWDGSRLAKDAERPRVDVTLTMRATPASEETAA